MRECCAEIILISFKQLCMMLIFNINIVAICEQGKSVYLEGSVLRIMSHHHNPHIPDSTSHCSWSKYSSLNLNFSLTVRKKKLCCYWRRSIFGMHLRTVPTNKRYFFPGVWLCRKCRSYQVLLKSKKKIGGNHAFFKDNSWIISVKNFKIQSNVWRSFSNWRLIISQKCMLTPNFLFGYKSTY